MTNAELDFLEKNNVIQKVNTSEWAHPMVIVPRAQGKKVRLCGDFKAGINRVIRVDDHPLKIIRHALDNIGNGMRFSKLDIFSAFLHMPVRESDRKFLVVNTHRGLYRFNRMSNGLSSAPAIWQRFIEETLAGIEGVECVMDDIIISAPTDEEHLKRLEMVFSRLDQNDIRLNAEQCAFFEDSVIYCGFRIKHQELHQCDDKLEAIKRAPSPSNVGELRSFLGMIQFYASFASKLSDLAAPLYTLLKSSVKFVRSDDMERAFLHLKQELCSPTVLVPFDPNKPIVLATDASPYGISAVLSHQFPDKSERPIAFYSRVLTETEKRYSQIDKEALGIKSGVERFFYYIFGRRFTLITDSKPLSQIFAPQRSLPPLSATRMQHYAVYLANFNFDIQYRPTELHGNADALSRLPVRSENLQTTEQTSDLMVHQIKDVPLNFDVIAQETKQCKELQPLLKRLLNSSHDRHQARQFGIDICEFSILKDSVILRGHRVVVPKVCRNKILKELHEGHYGTEKMKHLARRYVWWPSIDKDIAEVTLSCAACLSHARNPPREIIHSWKPPEAPLERLHLDYAGPIQNKYILLVVDAYSKWLEAFVCANKTSETTLVHLREIVARFGVPKVVVTDNDPTFVSERFNQFCQMNGIRHLTTPAFHPSSNGQIERYVQTTKLALKKMSSEGGDLRQNLSLFLYRQRMMLSSTGVSPAFRMLGREFRSRLDMLREPHTAPHIPSSTKFTVGQAVMARDYRLERPKWTPGRITRHLGSRMCEVKVSVGTWKRHFEQIRKRSESSEIQTEEDSSFLLLDAPDNAVAESAANEQSDEEFFETSEVIVPDSDSDTVNIPEPISLDVCDAGSPSSDTVNFESPNADLATVRRSSRSTKGKPAERYQS